jgi:hypothetical protein
VHNGRVTRAFRRIGALVAAAALVSATVSACGGDDGPNGAPRQEPTQSSPSSGEAASAATSESTDPDEYLPVPEGVELTPQGTELALNESAVVAWEPRQNLVGVLDITVTRLELTSLDESFEGWQLDRTAQKSTPYFVHATIRNVGRTDVGGREVPLYAVNRADTLIEASGFQARFGPCPDNGVFPERFGPGATEDLCLVYLIPRHGKLRAVSFRPSQDFDPITWTGPVKKLGGKPRSR